MTGIKQKEQSKLILLMPQKWVHRVTHQQALELKNIANYCQTEGWGGVGGGGIGVLPKTYINHHEQALLHWVRESTTSNRRRCLRIKQTQELPFMFSQCQPSWYDIIIIHTVDNTNYIIQWTLSYPNPIGQMLQRFRSDKWKGRISENTVNYGTSNMASWSVPEDSRYCSFVHSWTV